MLATALLLPGVEAKKRTAGSKQVNSRKRECEQTTCSSTHIDERENCVLRCQSEACYQQVYTSEELEPGEIDAKRAREFSQCVNSEARRGRRGGNAPPSPLAAEAPDEAEPDESETTDGGKESESAEDQVEL